MSRILQNSLPAERERGCIFAETFESNQAVVENGGAITSAPVINFGMTTDGTDDVVTYPEVKGVQSISFWVTLQTTTEDVMQLSSSHSIEAVSGTLTATGVTSPTFYVDGVATATITTARSHVTITTGTAFDADAIQVGQDDSFGQFKIEDLKLFDVALTAKEATDYYQNSTFNYRNKAVLDLPMGMNEHDATGLKTLDRSGKGNDLTFGDGSTSTTYPTKLAKHGYSFDGGDYLLSAALGESAFTTMSMEAWVTTTASGTQTFASYEVSGGTSFGGALLWASGEFQFYCGSVSGTAASKYAIGFASAKGNIFHLVGVHDGTNTKLWVNGENVATDAATPVAPNNSTASKLSIGSRVAPTGIYVTGKIYGASLFDFALTDIQIKDLYRAGLNQINNV